MSIQQNAGRRRRRRRGSKRLRIAIAIIAAIAFVAMGILWFYSTEKKISDLWAEGATAFFFAVGALFSFYQWILPLLPIDMESDAVPPIYSQSEYVARPPRSASRPHKHIRDLVPAGSHPQWHIPYPRNWLFTGRDATLATLRKRLTDTSIATLTQTQAVNGLGGTGKTQIALEYAYRYMSEYHLIGWVRADTRDTLMTDLGAIAPLLNLPKQGGQDPHQMVGAYKRWCVEHRGWLLIFDNVNDMEMIKEFLPVGGNGHVVLTTRISALHGLAPVIEVEEMSTEEGAELLLRRARLLAHNAPLATVSATDRELAEKIVTLLGGLPLALDCAGAYIEETRCTLSVCLDLYQHRRKHMLARRGTHKGMYPETVVTTWIRALREIKKVNAGAAALLSLCAFLAPEAISEDMFKNGGAHLGRPFKSLFADDLTFDEAIAVIRQHSLLKRNHETRTLSIHRLVQAVLEDCMSERQRRRWATRAVRLVYHALPAITLETLLHLQPYIAHMERCVELIDNYGIRTPEAVRLLDRWRELAVAQCALARLHLTQDKRAEAIKLYQQALHTYQKVADIERRSIAEVQYELARLYSLLGKQEQAEELYEQVIQAYETLPDSKPLDIAQVQLNLAQLSVALNKLEQAEELYQKVLTTYKTLPGIKHLDRANIQFALASLYQTQGKHMPADALYSEAIKVFEQVHGEKHPFTLTALERYASLLRAMHKDTEATELIERVKKAREQ